MKASSSALPGQRDDWHILANARRIASRKWRSQDNWVLAMEMFGVGSTSAKNICIAAGIDPYSKSVHIPVDPNERVRSAL